jgi:hypothetical protein
MPPIAIHGEPIPISHHPKPTTSTEKISLPKKQKPTFNIKKLSKQTNLYLNIFNADHPTRITWKSSF